MSFATLKENEISDVWHLASAKNYVMPNIYMPSMFIVVQGRNSRVQSSIDFKYQMIDSGHCAELEDVTGNL